MFEGQMIYPHLRRLRDAPVRLAQRRFRAAAVKRASQIAGKYHRGPVGIALLAFELPEEFDAGPVTMLPVFGKGQLILLREAADGIAVAGGIQQQNIGEVGKHSANRRVQRLAVE